MGKLARRSPAATVRPPPARSGGSLQPALDGLHGLPGLAQVVARLEAERSGIEAELRDSVLAQIPAYRETRNPQVLPQLARHGPQHLDEIVRLLGGGEAGAFDFVREHARLRAAQFFPLEALLHAYRCGHKVFARRLLDAAGELAPLALVPLAEFALEYTDAISTTVSAEYVDEARRLAAVAVDEQAALLDLLLAGYDEADRRVSARLRLAGYLDGRQSFCVVLAQSIDPSHMRDADRARRLADALDALLPSPVVRRLVGVRDGTVTMVLAAVRRVSGWTAPMPALSRRVAADLALAGNDVLIGIGPDVEATAQIPAAHRKAKLALQHAHVGARVRVFDTLAMRELVLRASAAGLHDLLPPWVDPLLAADRQSRGALVATLRAHAATSLNVLKTAGRLGVHPNTVYARLERIRALTGIDARTFGGLDALLLAIDLAPGR